jgi:hypothetical protein
VTDLWKVARIDTDQLDADRRAEILVWVAGLGVDIHAVLSALVVTQESADGSCWLHLSEFVFESGNKVWDHAVNRPYTRPMVIPITDFPEWLPAVSHQQGVS